NRVGGGPTPPGFPPGADERGKARGKARRKQEGRPRGGLPCQTRAGSAQEAYSPQETWVDQCHESVNAVTSLGSYWGPKKNTELGRRKWSRAACADSVRRPTRFCASTDHFQLSGRAPSYTRGASNWSPEPGKYGVLKT